MVYQYNRYVGEVDRSDQLINVLRHMKKYWKTYFTTSMWLWWMLIFYIECASSPHSHYEFREHLLRSLCSTNVLLSGGQTSRKSASININRRLIRMDMMRQCVYCRLVTNEKHWSTKKCAECDVPLCFQSWDCFTKWHGRKFTQTCEAGLAKPQKHVSKGRPKEQYSDKGER